MDEKKAIWGPGPWDNECDKEQWPDEDTGYACLIKRNHFGALCGYVGVSRRHPWYGVDYDDISASVHGGLTYSSYCQEDGPEGETICHVPSPGEPDRLWWVGFDCAHSSDITPGIPPLDRYLPDMGRGGLIYQRSYRTIAYVKEECASLARQAAEASHTKG